MRYVLPAMLILCALGCDRKAKPTATAKVETWHSGFSSRFAPEGAVVRKHGSQVLLVRNAPVDLRFYRIDDGEQKILGSLRVDPAVTPMAAFTIYVEGEEAVFEVISPHEVVGRTASGGSSWTYTWNFKEIRIPVPARIWWDGGMSMTPVEEEVPAFHVSINDTDTPEHLETFGKTTAENMIAASKQFPTLSFILVTARRATDE